MSMYGGSECRFDPLKYYSITEEMECENIDVVSFEITECALSSLTVNFYSCIIKWTKYSFKFRMLMSLHYVT